MDKWKITGLIATFIIVLSVPLYLIKVFYLEGDQVHNMNNDPEFVGRDACIECHKIEYDLWTGSDHDLAMDYANDSSVVGDFNNAELEYNGQIHKLYKKNGKFYAFTEGETGEMEEFEIKYTFGYHPLQQYLVEFDAGRLQTLPLTWDTISKQWYHMAEKVYPDEKIAHSNWLHWTNMGQNWNGMCADCHSTNLKKGFDHETEVFHTTWSEIDVSCEACHGPSSKHIEWSNLPEMGRPLNTNFGLVVQTSEISNRRYVDLCARCHTRRSALVDYDFEWTDLLDQMIPELVREPMYFADGQILEEDYVFGSFTQSRMYMEDVKCNDCHNVHSGKLILDGNQLCLQCHRSDVYDAYEHHFHQYDGETSLKVMDEFGNESEVGEGVQCINCHMPGRYYMGVDYRRDHSFRIPRPDLSDKLKTPNACTQCHANQSNKWAANYVKEWYGSSQRPHYGTTLAAGHQSDPSAFAKLDRLSTDDLYPVIVRATALSLIGDFYPDQSRDVLKNNLKDMESMIRYNAVRYYPVTELADVEILIPLLNDPVKAVRYETAVKLSQIPIEQFPEKSKNALAAALDEYKMAMEYSADFPASRHNLGNYYLNLGNTEDAVHNYKKAIELDDEFYPAKVNLAMLYNREGQNDKTELLLRDVTQQHPELYEANYSLGLLLAELGNYNDAVGYLEKAGELIPERVRIFYNLGLIYQHLGDNTKAEQALLKGININPADFDLLFALSDFYIKRNQKGKAKKYIDQIAELYPENTIVKQLYEALQ
jgi:predicted CXXCH cytochrome family protein